MQITNFTISTDKTQMDVTITDAASLTLLRLWKNHEYKDYSLATDLSAKLTASATETITITLADINATSFNGVYFLQAEEPASTDVAITAELSSFKDCILNQVMTANVGNTCLGDNNKGTVNAHMSLVNLSYAIDLQQIDEILTLLTALEIYCSTECTNCGGYTDVEDYEYRIFNDPDVVLDGGDII